MELEEQQALLELWAEFVADQSPAGAAVPPTGRTMREFYFEVVTHSEHYRYGMAPELFDLLIHGVFDVQRAGLWSSARRAGDSHRAA